MDGSSTLIRAEHPTQPSLSSSLSSPLIWILILILKCLVGFLTGPFYDFIIIIIIIIPSPFFIQDWAGSIVKELDSLIYNKVK